MNLLEILKDAFFYTIRNPKGWIIIGILYVISKILDEYLGFGGDMLVIIGAILSMFLYVILTGVSIMEATLDKSGDIPEINIKTTFIGGIKNLILLSIYELTPLLITLIIAIPIGFYSNLYKIICIVEKLPRNTSYESVVHIIPPNIFDSFMVDVIILLLVFGVLFSISSLFYAVAQVRLVETRSIKESLKINKLYDKIRKVGLKKYIVFILIINLLVIITAQLAELVGLIPYVGTFLGLFVISSFMMIFSYRGLTLIYMEE